MYQRTRQLAIELTARLPFGLGDFIMQSEFSRNMIKLSSGTAITTALAFFITPINTRLFSPEDYGLMNMIATIGGIFGVLLSFNLNPVILMEKHRKVAEATATLSLILLPVSLIFCWISLYIWGDEVLRLFNAEKLKPWMWLVYVMLIVSGLGGIVGQMIQRRKLYGFMSKVGVIGNLLGHAIRLPWGYFAPSFYALYVSNLIPGLLGFGWSLKMGWFQPVWNVSKLFTVFRKNLSFMFYQTLTAILGVVGTQLPTFWIAAKCSMTEVGYYGMAATLIDIPCGLLLGSFSSVYYKRVADTIAHEPEKLMSLYVRNTWKLLLLGLIPIGSVALISPFLPCVLGEKWGGIVMILQAFLIWKLIGLFTIPCSAILVILRKNFIAPIFLIIYILRLFLAFYLGGSNIPAVLLYAAVFSIPFHFILAWITWYQIRKFNAERTVS